MRALLEIDQSAAAANRWAPWLIVRLTSYRNKTCNSLAPVACYHADERFDPCVAWCVALHSRSAVDVVAHHFNLLASVAEDAAINTAAAAASSGATAAPTGSEGAGPFDGLALVFESLLEVGRTCIWKTAVAMAAELLRLCWGQGQWCGAIKGQHEQDLWPVQVRE